MVRDDTSGVEGKVGFSRSTLKSETVCNWNWCDGRLGSSSHTSSMDLCLPVHEWCSVGSFRVSMEVIRT